MEVDMSIIDFEKVKTCIQVPTAAEQLLSKPEKEISFSLNLVLRPHGIVLADAFVVYHNTARGPAKGGLRIAPHATLEHTRVLAELMSLKTALVQIPFGGGKSAIRLDPRQYTRMEMTALVKEYVHMLSGDLRSGAYVPAPDLGSTPSDMAVIYGETHIPESVTGKPPRVGGLPGRREATGYGVAHVARLACQAVLGRSLRGASVAVQGFGNVGGWAAQFLSDFGARVVAVSDKKGGVYRKEGLSVSELAAHQDRAGELPDFEGDRITNEELLALDVDVLIPAAIEDVIHEGNAHKVAARLVLEAANGPVTPEGDAVLESRGIPVIPDILANAGGVVASYVEWHQAKSGSMTKKEETYQTIAEQLEAAFERVQQMARSCKVSYRLAATAVAVEELVNTMRDRGWIPNED